MSNKELPYKAPDFSLPDDEGKIRTLADFSGNWLVLYFYPKDDTPGCTTQACSLRDARDDLTDIGVQIVGISKDSPESHEKFKAKYNLNFTLLSDEDAEVIKAYGAWGNKMFGKEGTLRNTFVINPDGFVVEEFEKVTPIGHGTDMIEAIKKLQEVN